MCWLHTAAASAASGPYQMRTNIAAAAVAAETAQGEFNMAFLKPYAVPIFYN